MKYDVYLFISDLFPRQSGGRELIDVAVQSHQRLKEMVQKLFSSIGGNDLPSQLIAATDRAIERERQRNVINNEYTVAALSVDMLDKLDEKQDFDFFRYIPPILAGYRVYYRDMLADQHPLVSEEVISLISWRTMSSGPESIHSIIQPKLDVFEKEAIARTRELFSIVSEHRKLFDDQQLLHAQAAEASAKAEVQLTAAGHAFEQKTLELDSRSQEIDGTIRQLRADLDAQVARFGTEAARKLWGEREKQSRFALIASSIAIFCLIAAPILGAICFTPEVLHYLAQIVAASSLPTTDTNGQVLPTPNDTQITIAAIGRLVIVTVPVFLYIWAIRLVVRFNSRSLLLLDDARLRLTMLDTFFHLIEKEGAVKEDRALVLNALFRPGPGHGDNVDPPNFTELVTKAMGSTPGK